MSVDETGVEPGFERVREVWQSADHGQGGGAFSAYVDGRKVVDLWGGIAHPGQEWNADTTTNIFSATKGVVAMCAAMLHSRGELDVDAPVSYYWPEFAQAGKDRALVRHLLTHSVGVLGLPDAEALLDFDGTGWDDYDAIAAQLAAAEPAWEPGTDNSYHAISYGWLVGELIRRITGDTLGAFVRNELSAPLGLDLRIGATPEEQACAATLVDFPVTEQAPEAAHLDAQMIAARQIPGSPMALVCVQMHGTTVIDRMVPFFGSPAGRAPEVGGANGLGSARDLARMYAALSMGGELDGVRLLSRKSVELFGAEALFEQAAAIPPLTTLDGSPMTPTYSRMALGFQMNDHGSFCNFGPDRSAYGHAGAGGQNAFVDPVNRVAVAYVRSHLVQSWADSARLTDALYESIDTVPA